MGKGQVSRRTLLGIASGAAVAGLAIRTAPSFAAESEQDPPVLASDFAVDIQGCPVSSAHCLSVDIDPLSTEPPGQAPLGTPLGPLVPGQARLRFLTPANGGNGDLAAWVRGAAKGAAERKDITVMLMKRDRSPARTYSLVACFPVKFDPGDFSTSGEANVAELVVQPTRVEPS